MKNFEVAVALTKEMCFVCRKIYDGDIIMNSLLTEEVANEVKELHGKVINYTEEPCSECKSKFEKDYIALIIINPSLSEVTTNGKLKAGKEHRVIPTCFIKKETLNNILIDYEDFLINGNVLFMNEDTAEAIGLIKFYKESLEEKSKENPK